MSVIAELRQASSANIPLMQARLAAELEAERESRQRLETQLEQAKEQCARVDKQYRKHKMVYDIVEDAYINGQIKTNDAGYIGAIARFMELTKEI